MTDTAIVRVTDSTTRDQLAIMLAAECFRAKRVVPVVGTVEYPTPWDLHHEHLDAMLRDWIEAR